MKQRCILLYAVSYNIQDGNDFNSGVSLWYLPSDDLSPVIDESRDSKGIAPCKSSADISVINSIRNVPGVYDVTFSMRTIANKPTLVPVGVEYVSDITLTVPQPPKDKG